MKSISQTIAIVFLPIVFTSMLYAQKKESDKVLSAVSGQLTNTNEVKTLIEQLKKQDKLEVLKQLNSIFNGTFRNQSPAIERICDRINSDVYLIKNKKGELTLNKKSAIIVLFRNMDIEPRMELEKAKPAIQYKANVPAVGEVRDANGVIQTPAKPAESGVDAVAFIPPVYGEGFKIDFSSINSMIFHKDYTDNWSNYLLATQHVVFVIVDAGRPFYKTNDDKLELQLSNVFIDTRCSPGLFNKSFKDLRGLLTGEGVMGKEYNALEMTLTIYEMDPKKIKDPCEILIQHKAFAKDLSFQIHEQNVATFQVGIVNDKYRVNNFSISDGKLTVKPDEEQAEQWKSNLNALIEIHLPRDVDNFRPMWMVMFSKNPNENARNFQTWLYNMTISRIGVYGGVKIAKDPLSNLHAGFNYAITKELYLNLGWTWINEVSPQVTSIGEISSISDAAQYAKRKYSFGKFSWGLSFAPSAIIDMLGIGKDKNE